MAFNAGAAVGKLGIDATKWLSTLVKAREGLRSFASSAAKNTASSRAAFKKLGTASVKTFSAVKGAVGTAIGALTSLQGILLTLGVGAAFRSVFRATVRFENALLGLRAVARATGNDVERVNATALSLAQDGLISVEEASRGLKNLLAIEGIGLEKATEAMLSLKDSAAFNRQGQLSMGEAVVGATQGLKNQLSILVDNAGITKNLSVLQKEYAKSLGTTVGKLTDTQKNIANVEGVIREGRLFTGNAAEALDTLGGQTDRLGSLFERLKARLIDTRGPLKDLIQDVGNLVEAFALAPDIGEAFGSVFSTVFIEVKRMMKETFILFPRTLTGVVTAQLKNLFAIAFQGIPGVVLPTFQLIAGSFVLIFWTAFKTLAGNLWTIMSNTFRNIVTFAKIQVVELVNHMAKKVMVIAKLLENVPGFSDMAKKMQANVNTILSGAEVVSKQLASNYRDLTEGVKDFNDAVKSDVEPVLRALVDDLGPKITQGLGDVFESIKENMASMVDDEQLAIFDDGLGRIRSKIVAFREQIMQDIKSGTAAAASGAAGGEESEEKGGFWSSLFDIPDDYFSHIGDKANGIRSLFSEISKGIKKDMTSTSQKVAQGMGVFGKSFASAAAAGNSFGDSMKTAMKSALASVLERISAESAVRTIFHTALGLASLAVGDVAGAANHFGAAALFGTVAGVAGAAAGRVGGGSAGGAAAAASSFTGSTSDVGTPATEISDVTETTTDPQRQVNITIRAEGFVDEEAMRRIVTEQIIPKINEEVNENGRVLVATNISDNGQLSQA